MAIARWLLLVGLLVALVYVALFQGSFSLGGRAPNAVGTGRIAWPRDGDLWVVELPGRSMRKVTELPRETALATGVAWSPDGRQLVYSQLTRRPGNNATGADLWIAKADGSEAHVVRVPDAPSTVLEAPTWAASGRIYYTERIPQPNVDRVRILYMVEGGQPQEVIDGAYGVSLAGDESSLVYLRSGRTSQSLWLQAPASGGRSCELVSERVFLGLGSPHISPDGSRVAFAASGEPKLGPAGCGRGEANAPHGAESAVQAAWPGSWFDFGPRSALAHGLPWDIWSIKVDGTDLARLAVFQQDDPNLAWSPDGTQLALFSPEGLFTVGAGGGQPLKLVERGAFGGLDWTR